MSQSRESEEVCWTESKSRKIKATREKSKGRNRKKTSIAKSGFPAESTSTPDQVLIRLFTRIPEHSFIQDQKSDSQKTKLLIVRSPLKATIRYLWLICRFRSSLYRSNRFLVGMEKLLKCSWKMMAKLTFSSKRMNLQFLAISRWTMRKYWRSMGTSFLSRLWSLMQAERAKSKSNSRFLSKIIVFLLKSLKLQIDEVNLWGRVFGIQWSWD